MAIKISTHNSKLGVIPSVNLPSIITCREGCPCAKDCYATKGRFRFKNVQDCLMQNYLEYVAHPVTYFDEIEREIRGGVMSYNFFRWHSSGDIVDRRYFDGMIRVAKDLTNTKFLAFTKQFEIVNSYIKEGNEIPENLKIVFSAWGNELRVDNPYHLPIAYVRFGDGSKDKHIPAAAKECSGNCTRCLGCWEIKPGESVVFNKH